MTTRLWLRVRQLLPMAEHAAAVAAGRDGLPIHPALVWFSDSGGDRLESSGQPVWYDADGHVHAATAETWTHTATGATGNPAPASDRDRHLPLLPAHPDGRRSLLDLLRFARAHEVNWLAVHPDPATNDDNTRFQIRVARGEAAPPEATWKRVRVTCPTVGGGTYPALIADGYTACNGVVARFSRETVQQMGSDLAYLNLGDPVGAYPQIDLFTNAVIHVEELDHDGTILRHEQDQVKPDADGCYAIGAYQWSWTPV